MASNFKILIMKGKKNLHLNLKGDFDGTSAHQLVDTLKKKSPQYSSVTVETNQLGDVHPFGIQTFLKHYKGLGHYRQRVNFKGNRQGIFSLRFIGETQ